VSIHTVAQAFCNRTDGRDGHYQTPGLVMVKICRNMPYSDCSAEAPLGRRQTKTTASPSVRNFERLPIRTKVGPVHDPLTSRERCDSTQKRVFA
jgi:hypothetical protein